MSGFIELVALMISAEDAAPLFDRGVAKKWQRIYILDSALSPVFIGFMPSMRLFQRLLLVDFSFCRACI